MADLIQCACGCGESLERLDKKRRPRKYIANHQTKTLVSHRKRPYGPSPTLGTKASDETRAKLSASHMGQAAWNKGKSGLLPPSWNKGKTGEFTHSMETRKAISSKLSGPQSHLWRGGIPQRAERTATMEWRALRRLVYARDNWQCSVCSTHCRPGNIICHHIVPVRHNGCDDLDNLTTVCRKCHSRQEWLYGTEQYRWVSKVGVLASKDNPHTVKA